MSIKTVLLLPFFLKDPVVEKSYSLENFAPAERMYMSRYNLGDAAGEEVPDYNASIITSHSKKRSKPTKKYLLNQV